MMTSPQAGYVSDELYNQITAVFPAICVDVIPFDAQTNRIGTIIRSTGKESGKMAIIGGRIKKGETIKRAIERHLKTDLSIGSFAFIKGNDESRPYTVQQYAHADHVVNDFDAYDPSKQSIGLTYLISLNEMPVAKEEASQFQWISEDMIPDDTAFNQGVTMKAAFEFLR